MHDRRTAIMQNGSKASTRYVICKCTCHDGKQETLDAVLAMCGSWDVPHPLNADAAEVARYVDIVNALVAPRKGADEEAY